MASPLLSLPEPSGPQAGKLRAWEAKGLIQSLSKEAGYGPRRKKRNFERGIKQV